MFKLENINSHIANVTRTSVFFIMTSSIFLYASSDTITRLFLVKIPIILISLFKFIAGTPIIFWKNSNNSVFRPAYWLYGISNSFNFIIGVAVIIEANITTFAVASLFRPIIIIFFTSLFARYVPSVAFCLLAFLSFVLSGALTYDNNIHYEYFFYMILSVSVQAFFIASLPKDREGDIFCYAGIYNICGVCVCLCLLALGYVPTMPPIDFVDAFWIVINCLVATVASVFALCCYRTHYCKDVSSLWYIKSPLNIILAIAFLNESPTVFALICMIGIFASSYFIGRLTKG